MKTVSLGLGLIAAFLLSAAALLFGLVSHVGFVSLLLLLAGAWMIVYAALFERGQKLYLGGWGVILSLLSSFYVIPIRYSVGLVLLALVAVIVVVSIRHRR